jgi:hypothetical protein
MYGSEKYMLHNIKDKCSHYLQASVDEESVCVVLQTAHDFYLDDYRKNALKFILSIGEPCLEFNSFLNLSPECLIVKAYQSLDDEKIDVLPTK